MYYDGRPCKYCGGTLRRKSNNKCVHDGRSDHYTDLEARRATYRRSFWRRREKVLAYAKVYRKKNSAYFAAQAAKRHARKLMATSSFNDDQAIGLIYEECRRVSEDTGVVHHVDHIVPLQGRNVCGLHVSWNLQILTADDNIRKSNRC